MAFVPPARHLLRAEDLADARFFEPLGVEDLAAAAGLSRAARLGSTCQAMGVTGLEPVTSTLSRWRSPN